MSTTRHQTWVRRAGRYFTDQVPGYTYRVSPGLGLGTTWEVARRAYRTEDWVTVQLCRTLVQAKTAALTGAGDSRA
jgi:hypothetical protein